MTGKFGSNQNREQKNRNSTSSYQVELLDKGINKKSNKKAIVSITIALAVIAIIFNFATIMDYWYYNVVLPLFSFLIPIILVIVVIWGIGFLLRTRRRSRYRNWW